MGIIAETIATLYARLGLEKLVIPVVETPTGGAVNLQGDANGYPYVTSYGGSTSAKQDTLAAMLASAATYQVYAPSGALSGDVSLTGSGDGYSHTIVVGTVGTLVLTRTDGTVVTIPADVIAMNPVLQVKATLIGSTSTAQKILVLW